MTDIRPCRDAEHSTILSIINAAESYRGVIPEDRWHEPYMPAGELQSEIAAGIAFWGYEAKGALLDVMGIQPVRDVDWSVTLTSFPPTSTTASAPHCSPQIRGRTTQRMLVGT
jgi:hypothetical protein